MVVCGGGVNLTYLSEASKVGEVGPLSLAADASDKARARTRCRFVSKSLAPPLLNHPPLQSFPNTPRSAV